MSIADTPEDRQSKAPALSLLCGMGYAYLSPEQALDLRGGAEGGRTSAVVLKPVLRDYLLSREFQAGGESFHLSPANVDKIISALLPPLRDGLIRTNEQIYDLLLHGITVTEFIHGKSTDCTISVIDWQTPGNNVFHVTEELAVADSLGTGTVIPDVVCYVNGLPLAVIECKRPDLRTSDGKPPYSQAISQMIRNQGQKFIPHLFAYAQLVLAVDGRGGHYGTCGTPAKFWANWREEEFTDADILNAKKAGLDSGFLNLRSSSAADDIRQNALAVSDQDRMIMGLLSPARFLESMRFFTLFETGRDGLHRLAARYQQSFGIKAMIERLSQTKDGKRSGGVIWHTTGSGKSYTMVMLAQSLVLLPELAQCRIVVVTDRVDLEKQILRNFMKSGILSKKEAAEARVRTGRSLAQKIGKGSERILFTIIDKFQSAAKLKECRNASPDIIVLVDEGHRSQNGETHQLMRQALPNAAFIAFTGTPLLVKEQSRTEQIFGRIIHAYTMQQAVEDETVVRLLYEERVPDLSVNEEAIDAWFERITSTLSDKQKADLKRKYARGSQIDQTRGRMELIAADISSHIQQIPEGMKGQLACSSKAAAIRYKELFDELGQISSAVVISAPDSREGYEEVDAESRDLVVRWWEKEVGKEPEAKYTQRVLDDFATAGGPKLLIVVSKLLTGFDEPRNMVLYIDKPLKQHELLQAIARVNRLHELKKFGYLVDYHGVLNELNSTMQDYRELAEKVQGYRADGMDSLYTRMSAEYKQLPRLQDAVWAILGGRKAGRDVDELARRLAPDMQVQPDGRPYDANLKKRDDFYAAVRDFSQCLALALQSAEFYEDTAFSAADRREYKADAKLFAAVRRRASSLAEETVDYDAYAESIRELLDKHIAGVEIQEPEGVYLVDELGRKEEEEPQNWSEGKARTETAVISSRIAKSIEVELADDPYALKYFSDLLKQAIEKSKELFNAPIKQYLLFVDVEKQFKARRIKDMPDAFDESPEARIWFGILKQALPEAVKGTDEQLAPWIVLAKRIEGIIASAQAEFSLSPEDMEKSIELALLQLCFDESAPEVLKDVAKIGEISQAVIHSLRVRMSKV